MLESKEFPNFYKIDGYSGYVININGIIINKQFKRRLSGSINPAGYCHYRLTTDGGSTMTIGRHRLMCIVFKPTNEDITNLYVNHKNGIKGHDVIDNLEWVTPKENAEHAGMLGISPKCKPLKIKHIETGKIEEFPSMIEGGKRYGISKDSLRYRLKYEKFKFTKDGEEYLMIMGEEEVNESVDCTRNKGVIIKDVWNHQISYFNSCTEAAEYLGVSLPTITLYLKQPNQPVVPGYIQIKFASDKTKWRMVGDPYLELSNYTKQPHVQIINTITGAGKIIHGVGKAAKTMGMKRTALSYRITTKGNSIFSDGCKYGYYPY